MMLLCWNLAGRQTRIHEQADVVCALAADVVCLQAVTPLTVPGWGERLEDAGYEVAVAELPPRREGSRPLGVLTAAQTSMSPASVPGVPGRNACSRSGWRRSAGSRS